MPKPPPLTDAALQPIRDFKSAQQALEKAPTLANQIRFARAAGALNLVDEAERTWKAAVVGQGANEPVVLMGYAALLAQLRKYGEALELLIRWKGLGEPENSETSLLFARIFHGLGQRAEADAAYRLAMADGSPFKARAAYVVFLAECGRADEARLLFRALSQEFMAASPAGRREVGLHLDIARAEVVRHGVI